MNSKKHISLSVKLNLFIITVILLVSTGLVWISYRVYSKKINNVYLQQAESAALDAQSIIVPESVEYMRNWINTDEFRNVRSEALAKNDESIIEEWLRSKPSVYYYYANMAAKILQDPTSVIIADEDLDTEGMSLYDDFEIMAIILESRSILFDVSAAYIQYDEGKTTYNLVKPKENLFYIGSIEEPIKEFESYGENESVPATIYRSPFGWICTATLEISDRENGKSVGTVGVDIDMELVVRASRMFLVNSAVYVILLTITAILISMFLMNRFVTAPLQRLSHAASDFAIDTDGLTKDDVIRLDIKSNDEIGDLYHQIQSMETRIIEYTDHLTQITAERERVNTELNMAEKIQRDMLPSVFPDNPEFDLYASMTPAREVGGDFYDFFQTDDTHLAVVIADVSDKGVPAALFMLASMILIRYRSIKGGTPAEILTEVNQLIFRNNRAKMFVTVWMGIIDLTKGVMTCTNAGHEYPFIRGTAGRFRMFKDKHGFVIGGLEKSVYSDYELKLEPGDAVFVYTDGVPEANNSSAEMFGMDRLDASLNSAPKDSPQKILERVKADIDTFTDGTKQFDDLTMLCFEYKGPAAPLPADHA